MHAAALRTVQDLAGRTGESVEWLARLGELGLIGAAEGFSEVDVEKVHVLRALVRHGIALEEIAAARGDVLRRCLEPYLEMRFADGLRPELALDEAARRSDLPVDLVARLRDVMSAGDPGEPLCADDIEMLGIAKRALELGFPEDALLQLCRVYADALGRAAEATSRLFHLYVHERLREPGLSDDDRFEAGRAMSRRLEPLVEPVLRYFQRKGQLRAAREDVVTHLSEELGVLREKSTAGEVVTAILFVDLASFTPLADTMGDAKAAEVLQRFAEIVRGTAQRCSGRIVKQIGDAFMLVFPEPRSAVECALDVERRISAQPSFPAARSGIHWGSALYREGDYVGGVVNVAARVAAAAERHQVLVTGAVRAEVVELPGVELHPRGKRRLKGLAEAVELFEARHVAARRGTRLLDPVCGMEMGPPDVAARLSLDGVEHAFCSQECLRLFVAAPGRYLEPRSE